ncbi:MAG: cysteine desulfurase family protein [bacterium]|nr:cysteine desulfurase family protein [bacterium]
MQQVYLDYNATTPVHLDVIEVMLTYCRDDFGNPSSVHRYGRQARVAVDDARDDIAAMLGVASSTICFSSGGTESNNTIIKGVAAALKDRGRHIVTSEIEHPAVLDTCAELARQGYEITYTPVTADGVVEPEAIREALTDETILVSIMHANNETGVVQPIAEIAVLAQQRGILIHTDAVQTFGKMPLCIDQLGVDFLSFSGHKIYAPKGIGGWYMRPKVPFQPLLFGGHQERGRRSGTENVPGIVALGKACDIAQQDMPQELTRQARLQQDFERGLRERIADLRIQGEGVARLPNTTNVAFAGVEGEALLMGLDLQGIAVATGSACSSGSLEASHVLHAMAVPEVYLHGALRFSLGRLTTEEDIDYVLRVMPGIVMQTRSLSPMFTR